MTSTQLGVSTSEFELRYNVKSIVSKPLEKLRYSTRVDNKSIVTNYFESSDLNSSSNILISDHSMYNTFNDRRIFDQQEFKVVDNFVYRSKYKFNQFTIFTGKNRHNEIIPLFYKQKTPVGKRIASVSITKITNSNVSDEINYGYAIVDGALYYNYSNEYDSINDQYRVYFLNISYTDGTSENTLINPVEAISKANNSNADEIRYTERKTGSGYEYQILTPNNKTIAQLLCNLNAELKLYVKEMENNSIYLKKPENQPVENEWFVEVVAGDISELRENNIFRYHVPEYKEQNFYIEAPNLYVEEKSCEVITERIIKLPYSKITYKDGFELVISTYDLNLDVKDQQLEIESVDEKNGFVELAESLPVNSKDDFIVKASFYYKTDTYFYDKINFNPYMNKDVLGKKYYFYIKPNEDVESIAVSKTAIDNASYLFLGTVSYTENYNLEESFSFKINNNERFFNFEDSLNKNPYILQGKFGYGNEGQKIQRNNVVVLELPRSFETNSFYTNEQLYELFKRKLKIDTNLILDYVDDEFSIKPILITSSSITLECSWEGLGSHLLVMSDDPSFSNFEQYELQSDNAPANYTFNYEIGNLTPNQKYWFKTVYDGKQNKRIYSIKTEGV